MSAHTAIITAKYIFAIVILITIVLAPAWLARQNKKDKAVNGYVRVGSWLFGWTIVGWLWALWMAVKK